MTTTIAALDGYFKERYADGPDAFVNAVSDDGNDIVAQLAPFDTDNRLGDSYHQPTRLTRGMGWTFAGGANTGTAFTLNAAISGISKDAVVNGNEFVLRDVVANGVVSRALANGGQAFGAAFDEVVADLQRSSIFARELSLLYGGSYLGAIDTGGVAGSGTTRTWTLSLASTSAAIWWQMGQGELDVYTSVGGVPTTQRNTNATIAITGVDLDSSGRVTVAVSGNATDLTAIVATDLLIPRGSFGMQMTGLFGVAISATSLYGISQTTYPLFKATSHDVGTAQATTASLLHALKKNQLKGGAGPRKALISLATFTDLNNNVAALQRFLDQKVKGKATFGTSKVEIESSEDVMLELKVHPLMREGESLIVDPRYLKRVGSCDHTFSLDVEGMQPNFFSISADKAGFELRAYWDQGLFCPKPSSITRLTNIVNSI